MSDEKEALILQYKQEKDDYLQKILGYCMKSDEVAQAVLGLPVDFFKDCLPSDIKGITDRIEQVKLQYSSRILKEKADADSSIARLIEIKKEKEKRLIHLIEKYTPVLMV